MTHENLLESAKRIETLEFNPKKVSLDDAIVMAFVPNELLPTILTVDTNSRLLGEFRDNFIKTTENLGELITKAYETNIPLGGSRDLLVNLYDNERFDVLAPTLDAIGEDIAKDNWVLLMQVDKIITHRIYEPIALTKRFEFIQWSMGNNFLQINSFNTGKKYHDMMVIKKLMKTIPHEFIS